MYWDRIRTTILFLHWKQTLNWQQSVNLHFLGTTGYHPNNTRQTACLMLPERGIILDAGTGIFRARDLIKTDHLDILLSHAHLDHVIGLTFLHDILDGKEITTTVHVAADKVPAIENHLFDPLLFPVKPNFTIQPFESESLQLRDGSRVATIPLEHPGGSHGFRFDWDHSSLAYITDTTATQQASYLQKIQGVTTLIHECYFPDGFEDKAALTGHSCLTPVAEVAALAKAGRTYLVHINPQNESDTPLNLDSVHSIYEKIEVAFDGQIIEL